MNFVGARITAINLFQVDLHKLQNYVWFCYEEAPPPPLPPSRHPRSGILGGSAAYFTVSSLRRCAVAHFGGALQCTARYGTLVAIQARKPP